MRDLTILQKPALENRRPLQESSKQNIVTPPSESSTILKGLKSAMQVEQVSNNHFKFTEENRPPDDMDASMDPMEETKANENSNLAVIMQEDSDMSTEGPTKASNG